MIYCAECRLPIEEPREQIRRIAFADVCFVCFELFSAISGNTYFVKLQEEYQEQVKRVNRLRSKGDYFGEK